MTDLRSLDARSEHDSARWMSSTGSRPGGRTGWSAASRDDEIARLREENERLKRGLCELRQLLDPPASGRGDGAMKVFPRIGLL